MSTEAHPPKIKRNEIRPIGKSVILEEAAALQVTAGNLCYVFELAINVLQTCKGRVVVSGLGKSGIIGKKIAATLSSTGTPSFFLHPTEAFHGDLDIIASEYIIILISFSGEITEVCQLMHALKNYGNQIIAIVGRKDSKLGRGAHVCLEVKVEKDACPHNLALTSPTTATLAFSDVIAVTLMQTRNFDPDHFARFHPGGSLGRCLITRVSDVMLARDLSLLAPNASLEDVFTDAESVIKSHPSRA
ncbi:MAG: KpsF/GutQ family sugar-phosphate isomerase [Oligoflexus sp.]